MLGTSSFHILLELTEQNKTKQLWVLSSMIPFAAQGASCLRSTFLESTLSRGNRAHPHPCVVATHCFLHQECLY